MENGEKEQVERRLEEELVVEEQKVIRLRNRLTRRTKMVIVFAARCARVLDT